MTEESILVPLVLCIATNKSQMGCDFVWVLSGQSFKGKLLLQVQWNPELSLLRKAVTTYCVEGTGRVFGHLRSMSSLSTTAAINLDMICYKICVFTPKISLNRAYNGQADLRLGGKLLRRDGQSKKMCIFAISETEASRFKFCLEALPCKCNSHNSIRLEPHPNPTCSWNWKAWLPLVPCSCSLKMLRSFMRMCS